MAGSLNATAQPIASSLEPWMQAALLAAAGLAALASAWALRWRSRWRAAEADRVRVREALRSGTWGPQRAEADPGAPGAELERLLRERTAALRHSLFVGGRERYQARQREEQFRRAVEASPAGFVMVDSLGRILLVNAQTEHCFGYDRNELVGQPVELLLPDALRERHADLVEDFMRSPRGTVLGPGRQLHGRRRDGSLFPVEIGLNPVESPSGLQVLASVLDISERLRSERALRQKTLELERSNRQLADFASVVSHDLRSPLHGIASLAECITADYGAALGPKGRKHLDLMRERTVWLHQMIEALLEYSRAGRGELRGRVDAGSLAREVVDVLAPPPHVEIRVEEPLPDCFADQVALAHVFQNLVSNAIQHLGKPTGTVTLSGRRLDGEVEYAVADDGVGISPEYQGRIFRMFQTLRPAGEGKRSTGMGLAIVQKIVESYGGCLGVESKVGEGATFRFTMPGVE